MTDIKENESFSIGGLKVFVAKDKDLIRASQELRYKIFCEEMGAKATPQMQAERRDFDEFDDICDHLLVVDNDIDGKVVGSYRLLRRSQLPAGRKFYTEGEYDISKVLEKFEGEILELGRSCIDKNYRTRGTIQLLWRAIGAYSDKYHVKLMFGCASFPGSDSAKHAKQLSYLYYNHLAPEDIRPVAKPEFFKPMDLVAPEEAKLREVLNTLPPLVKGYIRIGGFIGDGAFEDKNYNTTDVCIMLKTELITQRYMDRYTNQNS